ncbi:MAG: hypothetical protein GY856_00235 [bacterium]|nr:hypothetical protein [bacterium]
MARANRIFISDIHLSSQQLYEHRRPDGSSAAWYDPGAYRTRLLGFLDKHVLGKAEFVKDLVILGDLFDNWVCPADVEPPTWDELIESNKPEMKAFRAAVQEGIHLFYIPGNHDFDAADSRVEDAVAGLRVIEAYSGAGRTHAEHGHAYTLFNSRDFLNDPRYGRPVGYFIARLAATIPGSGRTFEDYLSYVDDVVEALTSPAALVDAIIEALAEKAGVDEIVMPGGAAITIDGVKERYGHLCEQRKVGLFGLRDRLFGRDYLRTTADQLCKRYGRNLVLFGHTHDAGISKDKVGHEHRIYANSGTWCLEKAHCVIVRKAPIKSGVSVVLAGVGDDGKIGPRTTERLD